MRSRVIPAMDLSKSFSTATEKDAAPRQFSALADLLIDLVERETAAPQALSEQPLTTTEPAA